MTEPRHGTGASGWCLGRKRCPECAYRECSCDCHRGANPTVPQGDAPSNKRAEMAQIGYPEKAGKTAPTGARERSSRGLTTGSSTPEQTERN